MPRSPTPPDPPPDPDARESAGPSHQQVHAHPDLALLELADSQWGVVARRQLAPLGLTPTMVRDRLARGRLVRIHRGVYAVGHRRLRADGVALAAVLAAGPGAVLSHRSAAGVHGIRAANQRDTDVTVDAQRRPFAGVAIHRARLGDDDVTTVDGLPVTTLARTLVDLAGVVSAEHLARALSEAERIHRIDVAWIEQALARNRTRNGTGHRALRQALRAHAAVGVQLTRSELELRFLRLLDASDLPRPRTNALVAGFEVDAWWPRAGLAVELDGWEHHRTRRAFQRDREKANALALHGVKVLRFTHHDVTARPVAVAAQLAAHLDAREVGGLGDQRLHAHIAGWAAHGQ